MQPPFISVVIPSFNEASSIKVTISEVVSLLVPSFRLEILLIDDGSTDDTAIKAAQLTEEFSNLRYIRLSRNFGKEAALTAGLNHAKGDAVIMLDADGQHPPEILLTFIRLWLDGYEVVYGVQEQRNEGYVVKIVKNLYYKLIQRIANINIPSNAGDFRLLDRKAVNSLNLLPENTRYMKGLYAWIGYRSIAVPYVARARQSGKSQFNFIKLSALALDGLTGFSVVPLRLMSLSGLLISIIALSSALEIIIEYFTQHHPIPGWPTLAVGIMFFAGIELLALGVIGEYIGKIFEEVKRRPTYLVAEEISKKTEDVTHHN